MPPSSSGLGHFPFTEVTGIRIPLGVIYLNYELTKFLVIKKSGWQDLNLRLSAPKADTLPNCVTSRVCIKLIIYIYYIQFIVL